MQNDIVKPPNQEQNQANPLVSKPQPGQDVVSASLAEDKSTPPASIEPAEQSLQQAQHTKKRSVPLLVIICAFVVCFLLIAGVIYMFIAESEDIKKVEQLKTQN